MSAAAAEGTEQPKNKAFVRKTKAGNLKDCHTQQNTVKKPICESRNLKGQCDSNGTLTKVAKKFYFDTKEARLPNGENDRELSFHERGQQQQNILHCLKGHNKRHGIVVDSNDVPFSLPQDAGTDSSKSTRQDNGNKAHLNGDHHSQSKIASTMYQTSQQTPQSDSKWEIEFSGGNKSAIILNKNRAPRHYQSQKEQATLTTHPRVNEADSLKSTPEVGHNNILHNNRKDINEHGDISKARLKTEKHYGPPHADSSARMLHFSSHDLCQHCQKCELKQKDKVVPGCKGTISLNSLKNVSTDCEKKSKFGHEAQAIKTDDTPDISGSPSAPVSQNEGDRPHVEKVLPFPPTVKLSSLSFTDCLKAPKLKSEKGKTSEVKSSDTFTEWMPDQFGDRCKHCSTSPIQNQTTPSKCHQQRQSSLATHNMPDVTRISKGTICSDQTGTHNYLTDKSCLENVVDLVSPIDMYCGDKKLLIRADIEFHKNIKRNSSSDLNSSLSDNCDIRMSASPSNTSPSPQKVAVTSSPGCCSMPQVQASETRSSIERDRRALNELPRSQSTTLPKTFPGKENSASFIMEETQTGVIVKRFSLEGKEFCEYKYYGDDTSEQTNIRRSENPKSLKALSASSVIAENFKQLPRGTHFGYDRNRSTSDQPAVYLTLSSPSDDFPENRQHTSDQTVSDSVPDSVLTGPRFYLKSPAGHNKPFYSNLLATSCEQPISDNQLVVPQKEYDNTNRNAGAYSVHEISSNLRAMLPSAHQELQEEETSLKHVQTNKDVTTDDNTSSAESASRLHTSPSLCTVPLSDESSSYKPKNPIPVTSSLPSNAMDCQSSRPMKCHTSNSDHHPNVQVEEARKRQRPSSIHETSSSSLNLPLRMTASYSHDPHRQLPTNNRPRAKDDIQCSESIVCSRQQNGSGSLYKRSHGFLRTNSPSDFFSIRPYVDYTASKASSDSGIPVHSDQIRSSTPKGMMFHRGSSSEKLNKDKKHVSNRKTRSSSEKSSKCCKSQSKCTENRNNLDEAENCQSNYSSRSRHSDGAKFNSQEEKCYQAQYPRYSADSSSLISNAFLQKMAHLPKHSIRPVSHPHVDDSHLNSFTRHASTNEDFSRNGQCSNGAEPTVVAGAHSSRSFRITASAAKNLPPAHSSDTKNEEAPHLNYEKHKSRRSSAKAELTSIQASPDLILSNDGSKEEATAKEKSPLSRKAQSFFSKLTHSPISLFHRDSKSPNPPK